MSLDVNLDIKKIVKSANVAEMLDRETLTRIGKIVFDEWEIDKDSRAPWEDKMKMALDLALQVAEEKTFPWPNAANIKFPLITIAALQYHARAYPSLFPGPDIVKCRVFGEDKQQTLEAQARRIGDHMSYQILEEDENWEDNMDRVLITQPIVGCAFKKTYFDPVLGHNVSENILAKDLYIPYFAPSLEKAARITQVLYLSNNDFYERVARGIYIDPEQDTKPNATGMTTLEAARQEAQGVTRPANDPSQPYEMLEQHRYLDLDGDGYEEPYVVTIRKDTKEVHRIVARFYEDAIQYTKSEQILSIEAEHYYTKFPFIPSPDGGVYDLGFGVLLGPLNESINTVINQLLDAGTLSNTAGGFLGRGVKMKGGDNSFRPFEWKRVDSTGDDLRKGILPLPVREPNNVLLQLLQLLINYGERIGMATDPMVGENPGQNTKAEVSRNMIVEGQRVFNGIFKRTYRSLKSEFRKLFRLNQLYLPDESAFDSMFSGYNVIKRSDYYISEKVILPAADPYMISDEHKMMQAQLLKQASMTTPGYNRYEVEKRFLQAIKVSDIEKVFPDPTGPNAVPPPQNPKVQVEQIKAQTKQLDIQMNAKMAVLTLMEEAEINKAKILELQAKAAKELAEAKGVETGHAIALLEAQIGAARNHQDGIFRVIEILQNQLEKGEVPSGKSASSNAGGVANLDAKPGNVRSVSVPPELASGVS